MTSFGMIMDPIDRINIKKDTSFALLLAAQAQGWQLHYMQQHDLFLENGIVYARTQYITVQDDANKWFELGKEQTIPLSDLQIIFMRKDPPFNMEYIYTTYLLELAEQAGSLVVNKPSSLRDVNEKLFAAWFPQCCPPTLVTRNRDKLKQFWQQHKDVIFKPLDGMGGVSIFHVREDDPNINVVLDTLSDHGQQHIMAQLFIPEIDKGDKRIILVDGEPIPYCLARVPGPNDFRGNLAMGAKGVPMELSERDRWICQQVGPTLKAKGLTFVGLDVIGDYLTEINVTSPTCIRELDAEYGLDIGTQIMEVLASKL